MGALVQLFLFFGVPLLFLVLGFFVGRWTERRHLKRLEEAEHRLSSVRVSNVKTFPGGVKPGTSVRIVTGESVVATDAFKNYLAKWRNVFGGEVRSYNTLVDRARRQAVVNVLEQADRAGCNAVCNLRLNTSTIASSSKSRQGSGVVEVLATATAYVVDTEVPHGPAA
jgi:uncharacterized protein YbjQ (UPF0145 family)